LWIFFTNSFRCCRCIWLNAFDSNLKWQVRAAGSKTALSCVFRKSYGKSKVNTPLVPLPNIRLRYVRFLGWINVSKNNGFVGNNKYCSIHAFKSYFGKTICFKGKSNFRILYTLHFWEQIKINLPNRKDVSKNFPWI
jgi:hypothetical protein